MKDTVLIVLSPLKAIQRPDGTIVLTKKFTEGMQVYADLWDGPMVLMCEPAEKQSDNLDNIEVDPKTVPYSVICAPFTEQRLLQVIGGPTSGLGPRFPKRAIVLASGTAEYAAVSAICKRANTPCVYVTEYSLTTRLQMVSETQKTPLHGWRRSFWERRQERKQIQAISLADGIQCNGTPTFDAYRHLSPDPMLFFDSRMSKSMMAKRESVERKNADFENRPIHLMFSGRLNAIKGVDDLPKVAFHLRQKGVPFILSICGEGDLAAKIKQDAAALGVADAVRFEGVLDFSSGLVPYAKEQIDLFVCCHRQGDPSCTYLETMACGVPIVGYGNEAFVGLNRVSNAGWVISDLSPQAMAEQIAVLVSHTSLLRSEASKSLSFALEHSFEETFYRRIDHLKQIASGIKS